jgi:hypothetical protein
VVACTYTSRRRAATAKVPERLGPGPSGEAGGGSLSAEERRRMLRAAALRPLNVLVLMVGAFATFLVAWWMAPLTLLTYATLIVLAARDPIFQRRILPGRATPGLPVGTPGNRDVSAERRARWLPRGETRQKVESALVVYRKIVAAIEESDDVTRAVLEDTVPKLHAAADRLVDIARSREQAAEIVEERPRGTREASEDIRKLEARIGAADAEISETFDKLLDLRARVVRVSLESGDPEKAAAFGASLDELNARLEALSDTLSPERRGSSSNSLEDGA